MSFRYHALARINDESLRQVYLNSLPTELQGELQRLIELSCRTLRDISLGEIHMFTHTALDKLCSTQRVLTKMIKESRKYDRYCKLPDSYHLKCRDTDHCNCRSSHHSRGLPLRHSGESGSASDSSDYSGPDLLSEAYQAISDNNLGPQIQVHILVEKYSKHVHVIVYFDTGAHSTMMNPMVIPPEFWKEESNEFLAADGQIFITKLVSKKRLASNFSLHLPCGPTLLELPFQTKISSLVGMFIANPSPSEFFLPVFGSNGSPDLLPTYPRFSLSSPLILNSIKFKKNSLDFVQTVILTLNTQIHCGKI
ncbi:hypothetical protein Ddye_002409 [Dipteronia dyeriana]|uniref:Uncharacterized protein n=1 Tax=Dipteronia dyeriana TaxID=168575 RepID=A0AAE0CUC9_9ROSI|nr:hypothetical protein Ddye_002409 [Dipteronia dyeriana]